MSEGQLVRAWLPIRKKRVETRAVSFPLPPPPGLTAERGEDSRLRRAHLCFRCPEQPAPARHQPGATPVFPSYFLQTDSPPPSREGWGLASSAASAFSNPRLPYSLVSRLPLLKCLVQEIPVYMADTAIENWIEAPLDKPPHTWHRAPREQVLCILPLHSGAVTA